MRSSRRWAVAFLCLAAACGDAFRPPDDVPPPPAPRSEAELVQELAQAYRQRDFAAYSQLFTADEEAPFMFILDPHETGTPSWGLAQELRIHARMFEPECIPPGDPPLSSALWPMAIVIALTPLSAFEERTDLYAGPGREGGLDSLRWRATEAVYATDVFWDLAGETDFLVDGLAAFVVVEDRPKPLGERRKFLIYRWEDLGFAPLSGSEPLEAATWSRMKALYDGSRIVCMRSGPARTRP